MTYAILMLMMALQVGQSVQGNGVVTTGPMKMMYEPYYWAVMKEDSTGEAVRCTFGQMGAPGKCVDSSGQQAVFPVSCDAPKDGYFTHCRIVASARPCPQDLMPLVEPLPPDQTFSDTIRVSEVRLMPSVVPAIQEYLWYENGWQQTDRCFVGKRGETLHTCKSSWACADHSRVLLQSEDGTKHWCVRF